jgi:hypothetical protein
MSNTPNYRLPVKREVAQPPAVWQQAAPVVIRGAALVAAGVIAEWMLRSAAKKAASTPFRGKAAKTKAVARSAAATTISYTETIIVQRTITQK